MSICPPTSSATHAHKLRLCFVVGALLSASTIGCRKASKPEGSKSTAKTRAYTITKRSDLVPGPGATGALGDLRLENELIAAVISHDPASGGFAATGGNLIDLAFKSGVDNLNEVFLYLEETFPRQAHYASVQVHLPGGAGTPASIRAIGHDTHEPRINITTDYIMQPGVPYLTIRTRFTNTSTVTFEDYTVGDAVQWGRTEHMAPGHGFELPGRDLKVDWVCGLGDEVSYAVVPDGAKTFECLSGNVWSDPVGLTSNIEGGQHIEYVRHVVVGRGDTASLAETIAGLRRDATGSLKGVIAHRGQPVAKARVWVLEEADDSIVGMARTDNEGRFNIQLPPGSYRARAEAPGRHPVTSIKVAEVNADAIARLSIDVGDSATAHWEISEADGRPLPVRLTWEGVGGTEHPNFGPAYHAAGADNHIVSTKGNGSVHLVPGTYRVLVSAGPEYDRIDQSLTVSPGGTATIAGQLNRVVPTPGLISADLHQHARPSFDSAVNLHDRAASNLAEGVEVLVATDHNAMTDYSEAIASLDMPGRLVSIVGTEATTHTVGHFNAFPLRYDANSLRGGMFDAEGLAPTEIFRRLRLLNGGEDVFIQINHPRSKRTGYFAMLGFDRAMGGSKAPAYDPAFDGLEIVVADEPEETREALLDWFSLLNVGRRITATGNSDSHTISRRPVGWPRTYVCSATDDPAKVDARTFTKALLDGCASVSRGPIVRIDAGKVPMGGIAAAPEGRLKVRVRINAAPWIAADRALLYVDGKVVKTIELKGREPVRHDGLHTVSCSKDCWVATWVEGDEPLAPILGRPGQPAPRPLALSNPIFIDTDGDGRFKKAARSNP